MELKDIHYSYPFFEDQLEPKGALAINKESHACFYYLMLAVKARAVAGKGIESQTIIYKVGETPPEWMEPRDEEIAKSVAIIYGLESPEDFLKEEWKRRAWVEATSLGIDKHVAEEVLRVRPSARRIH